MKLRQKLAVVLASAMAVTAVPVVTMAASSNSMVKSVIKAKEDTQFFTASTAASLRIQFNEAEDKEVFYVKITNSEWTTEFVEKMEKEVTLPTVADGKTAPTIKLERQGSKVIKVTYEANDSTRKDNTIKIPLLTELKGGEATVAIESSGSTSTSVSEGNWVYATTVSDDEVATVSAGSAKSLYTSGKIADITFKETFAGVIGDDTYYAVIDLKHGDYEFKLTAVSSDDETHGKKYKKTKKSGNVVMEEATSGDYTTYYVTAEYQYGFASKGKVTDQIVYLSSDKSTMVVPLVGTDDADSVGTIKLKGVEVKSTTKSPKEGELKIDVSGDVIKATGLVVAKVNDYGVAVSVEDDEIVEVKGGRTEEITFSVSETVDDSFTEGREFTVKLDKGYFLDELDTDAETIAALAEFTKVNVIQDGDKEYSISGTDLETFITDIETNDDDQVIGFEFTLDATALRSLKKIDSTKDAFTSADIDEIEFETEISANLEDEGDITLTAEGRAIPAKVSGVIAKAIKPFTVAKEDAVLKVGLQSQVAGKITITESDAEMFIGGEYLYVVLPEEKGFTFEEEPTIKITAGDLQIDEDDIDIVTLKAKELENIYTDYKTSDDDTEDFLGLDAVKIKIKRSSNTASTLELSGFEITTDRTVAQGTYDVTLAGKALADNNGQTIDVEKFIVIGTPNTEDIASELATNGLAKGTAKFVIGEAKYTDNKGETKTMDAASYIQDPGYTMVPVRYVAEAFGVAEKDILFSNGTATIFAGTRTIQLTSNSNVAMVNGAAVTMGTKVVIKDGRTYAPVGEVARILGIATSWDSSAKTATFENK